MIKKVNNQFGNKTLELFELMENTENWEQYVTEKTANIVKYVKEHQSMNQACDYFDVGYPTIRSHILKAIERIKSKNTEFRRSGQSKLARELFSLMENTPNWEDSVTKYEAELAKKFKEVKNFYQLGKELNMAPSNIAGTLYGTSQKIGVINKIKEGVPQSDRRNFTVLSNNQHIEDLNAE